MQKPSDERLIAYLDGELDESERAEIALWLERDVALRERAARLTESAALLRSAFDDVLHEPLPERLVEAAHGAATGGAVVDLAAVRSQRVGRRLGGPRWWMGMASAASLFALLVGIGAGYIAGSEPTKIATGGSGVENASDTSPDNLAGYYKRYVNVSPDEAVSFDKLPQNFAVPNLKPWGLEFQGARFLMTEGQPGTALLYTTSNAALGPVIIVVANSAKPDSVSLDKRGDINVVRWRHNGHAYAIAGTASTNYLWNLHNDLWYQFDGI